MPVIRMQRFVLVKKLLDFIVIDSYVLKSSMSCLLLSKMNM